MKAIHSGEALRTLLAHSRPPKVLPASCPHFLGGLVFLKGLGEAAFYQPHPPARNDEPTLVVHHC